VEPSDSTSAKFQDRGWLHVALFMATFVTTTFWGAIHYASYLDDFSGSTTLPMPFPALFLRGFWFSITALLFLSCHEMGHYLACRYYNVDASLPFFLPMPFAPMGTFGAFIRMRELIPRKRMVFDIGIAGPIAGFAVLVPALILGIAMSHVVRLPADTSGLMELGEPLLFQWISWLVWGSLPTGYSLNLHPVALAAWFGLLATAINLLPISQFDGGHISYAILRRRSVYVTYAAVGALVGMVVFLKSSNWILLSALVIVMLRVIGAHHPPVLDEDAPLDRPRIALALFAVAMFVTCFTPSPIRLI